MTHYSINDLAQTDDNPSPQSMTIQWDDRYVLHQTCVFKGVDVGIVARLRIREDLRLTTLYIYWKLVQKEMTRGNP